jgi:hypothetical protein
MSSFLVRYKLSNEDQLSWSRHVIYTRDHFFIVVRDSLDLLTNATVVYDAIRFVTQRQQSKERSESHFQGQEEYKEVKEGIITSKKKK